MSSQNLDSILSSPAIIAIVTGGLLILSILVQQWIKDQSDKRSVTNKLKSTLRDYSTSSILSLTRIFVFRGMYLQDLIPFIDKTEFPSDKEKFFAALDRVLKDFPIPEPFYKKNSEAEQLFPEYEFSRIQIEDLIFSLNNMASQIIQLRQKSLEVPEKLLTPFLSELKRAFNKEDAIQTFSQIEDTFVTVATRLQNVDSDNEWLKKYREGLLLETRSLFAIHEKLGRTLREERDELSKRLELIGI